jgi:hypothetical protein
VGKLEYPSQAEISELPRRHAMAVARQARLGDPYPLIGRLCHFLQFGGEPLCDDEIQFIVKALKGTAGKRSGDNLRKIEQYLIAAQVEGLVSDGMPKKAAVDEVMRQRDRSRRHVYKAIAAHKEKSRGG